MLASNHIFSILHTLTGNSVWVPMASLTSDCKTKNDPLALIGGMQWGSSFQWHPGLAKFQVAMCDSDEDAVRYEVNDKGDKKFFFPVMSFRAIYGITITNYDSVMEEIEEIQSNKQKRTT